MINSVHRLLLLGFVHEKPGKNKEFCNLPEKKVGDCVYIT